MDDTVTCLERAKNDMGEARLDIIDSEVNRESSLFCFSVSADWLESQIKRA